MNKQLSMSFVQYELTKAKTNKTTYLVQMNRLYRGANGSRRSSRTTTNERAAISPTIWN